MAPSFSGPKLLSSSFDAVVRKVKVTKGAFHKNGSLGAISTSDPISEPDSFTTRVKDMFPPLYDGDYPTDPEEDSVTVGAKVKVREKVKRRK